MSFKPPETYTLEELRRLLVEKRWEARQVRLERFRRTGRIVEPIGEDKIPDKQAARAGEANLQIRSLGQVWMDHLMVGV